ncbi:MAG TPA: maleylpyruvate isomerase N-terminal domain-containing protein [Dehalococcoidia bacterium]|nr:maleylpyruvate isomerase N-terminal domain-containing protein [Dehalococcoidia bacterium]
MIPDVAATAACIAAERARFVRFCRGLTEAELQRPVPGSHWIVKDFISHLATIDAPVAAWFRDIADGTPAGPGGRTEQASTWDVDRFNDAQVAERRSRSLDAIFAEAADERAALVSVLDRLTGEQLARTIHFGGDSKRPPAEIPLGRYLQGWSRHDAIHVADMLKALPERRADPAVAAWLTEPEVAAIVGMYQRAMDG